MYKWTFLVQHYKAVMLKNKDSNPDNPAELLVIALILLLTLIQPALIFLGPSLCFKEKV